MPRRTLKSPASVLALEIDRAAHAHRRAWNFGQALVAEKARYTLEVLLRIVKSSHWDFNDRRLLLQAMALTERLMPKTSPIRERLQRCRNALA